MFAYIIIGIELAILYFVFWVVFLREPKPYEIRAELWGHYESSKRKAKQDSGLISLSETNKNLALFLPSRIKKRFSRMAKLRTRQPRHSIKNTCSCACHNECGLVYTTNWRGQFHARNYREDNNRKLAEKFLLILNRTLNKLSVKIPTLD